MKWKNLNDTQKLMVYTIIAIVVVGLISLGGVIGIGIYTTNEITAIDNEIKVLSDKIAFFDNNACVYYEDGDIIISNNSSGTDCNEIAKRLGEENPKKLTNE
ncbi:hypothetical protein HQ529_02450 [Candidatus Woesearchaeota archaeon]|nr:hypothetical protein [Candidatus Woesearchaeota archaeon]